MEEDVLMHYGVKGMKWGVRKDKSKDKRNVKSVSSSRSGVKKASSSSRKSVSSMSDEELKQAITRLRLEKEYNDFFKEKPKEIGRGRKFVRNILDGGVDAIPKYAWQGIGKALSSKTELVVGGILGTKQYLEFIKKQEEEERKREEDERKREEDERKKREAQNK